MPFISILLPTYNGSRAIAKAIKSVLNQTHRDFELIVIDDGSRLPIAGEARPESGAATVKDIVAQFLTQDGRIRYIRFTQNRGIQQALAAGFKSAKGEYIARIDDDDVWGDIKKLETQLKFFKENPECVLVGTGVIIQNEQGKELFRFLNPQTDADIRKRLLYRNCFSHSTVLFKKSAAEKFNGYDTTEATRHAEDYDLWLKLGTVGRLANLPDYSVRLTAHQGTISGRHKLQQFKNQLALLRHSHFLKKVRMSYPGYRRAVIKSYLRLILYAILGAFIPVRFQNILIKQYKDL